MLVCSFQTARLTWVFLCLLGSCEWRTLRIAGASKRVVPRPPKKIQNTVCPRRLRLGGSRLTQRILLWQSRNPVPLDSYAPEFGQEEGSWAASGSHTLCYGKQWLPYSASCTSSPDQRAKGALPSCKPDLTAKKWGRLWIYAFAALLTCTGVGCAIPPARWVPCSTSLLLVPICGVAALPAGKWICVRSSHPSRGTHCLAYWPARAFGSTCRVRIRGAVFDLCTLHEVLRDDLPACVQCLLGSPGWSSSVHTAAAAPLYRPGLPHPARLRGILYDPRTLRDLCPEACACCLLAAAAAPPRLALACWACLCYTLPGINLLGLREHACAAPSWASARTTRLLARPCRSR